MSFSELSCIQPYLVVYFITLLKCLRIDILSFVVIILIGIWIFISIRYLVCQLFIIVNKFITCNIEFRFIQDILLWVEFWSFWWSHLVVELFISDIAYSSYKNFSCSIVFNCDCYIRFHRIISDSSVSTFHFFNCEIVNSCLFFLEFKFRELNVT